MSRYEGGGHLAEDEDDAHVRVGVWMTISLSSDAGPAVWRIWPNYVLTMSGGCQGGIFKEFFHYKVSNYFCIQIIIWNISNQWLCKWLWENIVKYRKHDKKLPIISYFHDKKVEVYPPLADGDVTLDIEHWPQPGWPPQDPGPPHSPHTPRHANNQKLRILSQRIDHFWILVLITNFPHMSVTRPPCNTCLKSHFWHMITGWLIRIM